jgi:hypothetical protein
MYRISQATKFIQHVKISVLDLTPYSMVAKYELSVETLLSLSSTLKLDASRFSETSVPSPSGSMKQMAL